MTPQRHRYILKISMVLCVVSVIGQMNVQAKQDAQQALTLVVPSPLTVGIDDVGWKQGWSTDVTRENNKPHHIDGWSLQTMRRLLT